jgi:hypothetical protein
MIDTSRNALIGTHSGKRVKPPAYHDVLPPEPVSAWANQTIAITKSRASLYPCGYQTAVIRDCVISTIWGTRAF